MNQNCQMWAPGATLSIEDILGILILINIHFRVWYLRYSTEQATEDMYMLNIIQG